MNDAELDRHARAIAAELEDEHPDLETELFPYAEDLLPPNRRAAVAEHLAECARCREDVGDARALAPARPRGRLSWLPVAAVAAGAAIAAVTVLLLTRDDAPRQPAPAIPNKTVSRPAPAPSVPAQRSSRYARAEWETLVRDVRAGAPVALPDDLPSLRDDRYVLRGASSGAKELVPAGVIVESQRPELRWPAPENARSVVAIFAGDTEVARSGELAVNRWTPGRELRRGVTYTWQAELRIGDDIAIVPAPPSPPARFRVLDASTAAELDEARRAHDDPFLLGLLYAKAGLVSEARFALAQVTAPDDAPVAHRLLRQLPRR